MSLGLTEEYQKRLNHKTSNYEVSGNRLNLGISMGKNRILSGVDEENAQNAFTASLLYETPKNHKNTTPRNVNVYVNDSG